LIALAGVIFVYVPYQRQLSFDEGMDEGMTNIEQQLQEAHEQGFAAGELSIQNYEQIDENSLAQYVEQIEDYQNQISDLEAENENLQAEIDIFIGRGEPPVPRDSDGSPTSIVSLRNMTNIGDYLANATVRRDNYDNHYTEVLHFEDWHNFRDFNNNNPEYVFHTLLDSRYTRVQGIVFVKYGEARDRTIDIRFELDGNIYPLATSTFDKTTRPILIDIDLSDVNEFRIVVTRDRTHATDFVEIHFADFNFYP